MYRPLRDPCCECDTLSIRAHQICLGSLHNSSQSSSGVTADSTYLTNPYAVSGTTGGSKDVFFQPSVVPGTAQGFVCEIRRA
eukprot:1229450-Pyramimonas_sp.AAC.1